MLPKRYWVWVMMVMVFMLGACSKQTNGTTPAASPAEPTATPLPEIQVVQREQVLVGVDAAFPPFADLDGSGELVGMDIDAFSAIAEAAELDYQFIPTSWDTIYQDLISGRFDAAVGGIAPDNSPAELVDLTDPYLEIGQVAVVRADNAEFTRLDDLVRAVVGVQPLSWGEYAAAERLPAGNLRRYATPEQLIGALFDGRVDAIITHHTVVESYLSVNPGDLVMLGAPEGGRDGWLDSHSVHVAVPKGADLLLSRLNAAIAQLQDDGRLAELVHAWGFTPEFTQRPKFVQDTAAASLIAGLEKVDDYTVRFVLNRPDPFFEYKLTVPALAIHSPANLEKYSGGGDLALNPVGTGPYRLGGWEPGQAITLTANLNYWGQPAKINTLVVEPVPDPAERYAMLKANRAQLIDNLGAEELAALAEKKDDKIAVYARPAVNAAYLGMNRDLAPFDDRTVRLAVATCIDQPKLVETVYPTGTLVASQFVPPNTFGFTPGLLWYQQDAEAAAALLADSDSSAGFTVTLYIADQPTDYLPTPRLIAETIQGQLAACNITATVQLLDPDTFADRWAAGELPLFIAGWSADFPGPINLLNTHFAGVAGIQPFGSPYPEVVDLLEEAAGTADRAVRQERYGRVNNLLKEKAIFVPLAHGGGTLVAHADLPGVVTSPVRREALASVGPITGTMAVTTFVYAQAGYPLSLDPSDEMDDATFAITGQVFDTLVDYEPATAVLTSSLALSWSSNDTFDVWEFALRPGVTFHDGTPFNADAVLVNFERLWDAEHPWHTGRSGQFRYFQVLFGGFRTQSGSGR